MLSIDLEGAQCLLGLVVRVRQGYVPGDTELEAVLAANAFFVEFYSQWQGLDRETIKVALSTFDRPEWGQRGALPACLAEGFRRAADEVALLQERVTWLKEVEPSTVEERVQPFLPAGNLLDSVIHITIDLFNNAFVHRGQMGVSLLKGAADRRSFEDAVAHELHHLGFRSWAARDNVRQALLQQRSGCSVAVRHVQNLLAEGLANYYCTPGYVFSPESRDPPDARLNARLTHLSKEEEPLFAQAEEVLAMSLRPGAAYEPCWEAFKALAFDLEDRLLPAAHYLGARMVQTMDRVHPREAIVNCVRSLPRFLPLYNQAAQEAGDFVFDGELVERFVHLWTVGK